MQDIESTFFENCLQAFSLSRGSGHFLWLSSEASVRIRLRNDGVTLLALCTAIGFVYFKCLQCIWWQQSMSRQLIKNEQSLAVGMGSLKDLYHRSYLIHGGLYTPPPIPIGV